MRRKIFVFVGLLILFLIGPSVVAISSPDVDLRDAYHYYCDFEDDQYDAFYIEWWYFNLFDADNDIQMIFHYSILNPENLSEQGMAGVGAVAYMGKDIVINHTDWSDSFEPSCESCDDINACEEFIVGIEHNYIKMIDSRTYRIYGSIGNGLLSWELTYKSPIDPWFAYDGAQVKVGLFSWEKMSWFVHMPGASVDGKVTIIDENGNTTEYSVEGALGYHDHNWGEWFPTNVLWNWAQYFEPEKPGEQGEPAKPALAFEMGDFRFKPVGIVSVDFDGTRTDFEKEKGEYIVIHTRWGYDWENQKWFPARTWLLAENETRRLIVRMRTIKTEAVLTPLEMPIFLPEVIIYEQTASYVVLLWEKNQRGEWEFVDTFRGNGFKEYAALKWVR